MGLFIVIVILVVLAAAVGYVMKTGWRRVDHGMIGLQHRRFGIRKSGENSRVAIYGGPGPQAKVLPGNNFYFRSPLLYEIEYVPQVYVPAGTIGLVESKAGAVAPPGTYIAPFVDCNYFQDGEKFLLNGGQQGRQLQVLSSGHYDINPHIFNVITVANLADYPHFGLVEDDLRETEVAVGEAGVVITHLGSRTGQDRSEVGRHVPDHHSFQWPWVFLAMGGQQGVQGEYLPEGGHYAINPWFAHVVKVPTRNLILEWTKASKSPANFDAFLGQIVLDVQGYTVRLDMSQTLRIPAEAAPHLVRRFGDRARDSRDTSRSPVQEFVEKELATTVQGYFRKISGHYEIFEFITKYDELGGELSREVRRALVSSGIEAVATTLDEFTCEPGDMNELRRSIALEKHKVHSLEAVLVNSRLAADIEKTKIELDAARRRLELVQIQGLVELLGPAQIATERVLAEWVKMGVPHTIVSGGNDEMAKSIMEAMPFTQARDMLLAMASESGKHLASAEQQQAISSSGADDK
jgi:hypothetical protein